MGMSSATIAVDLVSKIAMTPGCGILTRFLSRAFKPFLPGSTLIVDYVSSIFHVGWISSNVSLGPTTIGISCGMVGRMDIVLMGLQSISLLLCTALASMSCVRATLIYSGVRIASVDTRTTGAP